MTLSEIQTQVESLPLGDQLALMESLAKTIRHKSQADATDWQIDEMAADPDIQREIAAIQREFAITEADGLQGSP